jgi:hypothetical protein
LDFHHVTYLSRDLRFISARHLFNIYINLLTPGSSVRLHGGNPLPAFTVPAILLTSTRSLLDESKDETGLGNLINAY